LGRIEKLIDKRQEGKKKLEKLGRSRGRERGIEGAEVRMVKGSVAWVSVRRKIAVSHRRRLFKNGEISLNGVTAPEMYATYID